MQTTRLKSENWFSITLVSLRLKFDVLNLLTRKKGDLAVLFLKQGPSPWRRLKQQKLEPLAFPVNRLWTSIRIEIIARAINAKLP